MELPKVPDVAEQSCPPTQVQPPAQWSNIMMMRRWMIMMMRRRTRALCSTVIITMLMQ